MTRRSGSCGVRRVSSDAATRRAGLAELCFIACHERPLVPCVATSAIVPRDSNDGVVRTIEYGIGES